MTVVKTKKDKFNIMVEVITDATQDHRYALKHVWNDKLPLAMVITNWPGSTNALSIDMTTERIIDHVNQLGFGGVVQVNLFSQTKLTKMATSSLKNAFDNQTIRVIQDQAKSTDQIIIATGSLTRTSKVALKQQQVILAALTDGGHQDKIQILTDGQGRPVHPISPKVRYQWNLVAMKNNE